LFLTPLSANTTAQHRTMTAHPEETANELIKTDAQLKTLPTDKYGKLPAEAVVDKTAQALKAKNFTTVVVNTGADALDWIKKNIPAGKSVMNGHSTTLVSYHRT
jgi:hypothetical protein